jgi:hyperosmotically inducible periplasmic protein
MNCSNPISQRWATPRRWLTPFAVLALAATLTASCGGKTVRPATDDGGVSTRVRTALLNDPQVAATNITVTSTNGVVTLAGRVRTPAEAERAVAVARQTTGVADVRSELSVAQP